MLLLPAYPWSPAVPADHVIPGGEDDSEGTSFLMITEPEAMTEETSTEELTLKVAKTKRK